MKVKSNQLKRTGGVRWGNILHNFTTDQLAWIGAVAMVYNEAEAQLHRAFGATISYPGRMDAVSTRINGTDGLIALIEGASKALSLEEATQHAILLALRDEGFAKLKSYRDGVIHARLYDMATAVGTSPYGRGETGYVLLSDEALEGLYFRLELLSDELDQIETIIICAKIIKSGHFESDQHKAQLEESIRDATS